MLIGEYSHAIDAKGRLNFPVKLREEMGKELIITRGLDGCLFVYSKSEFENLEQKLKTLPMSKARNMQRFLFAGANVASADAQGRIVIPQNLRDYAGLQKEVTIIGASSRVEIWNSEKWNTECSKMSYDNIAEIMDELDF